MTLSVIHTMDLAVAREGTKENDVNQFAHQIDMAKIALKIVAARIMGNVIISQENVSVTKDGLGPCKISN